MQLTALCKWTVIGRNYCISLQASLSRNHTSVLTILRATRAPWSTISASMLALETSVLKVIFVLVRLSHLKNALLEHTTMKRANGSASDVLKDSTVPQGPCLLSTIRVQVDIIVQITLDMLVSILVTKARTMTCQVRDQVEN